jgi:hypothetical protein
MKSFIAFTIFSLITLASFGQKVTPKLISIDSLRLTTASIIDIKFPSIKISDPIVHNPAIVNDKIAFKINTCNCVCCTTSCACFCSGNWKTVYVKFEE